MRRYSFRLATVLRVRIVQQERAKLAFQLAQKSLSLAEAELESRRASYLQIAQDTSIQSPDEFAKQRFRWEQSAKSVEAADEIRLSRAAEAELKRHEYIDASREVEILERLNARRKQEFDLEVQRDEIKEVDDIVTARYGFTHGAQLR